jgi:hypothetical protein
VVTVAGSNNDELARKTLREIRTAVEFHIEGLRGEGEPVAEPSTSASYVEVAA